MNTNDTSKKTLLAEAVQGLRESEPPADEAAAAAERVRRELAAAQPRASEGSPVVFDCAGYVEMIPAYRQGALPAATRKGPFHRPGVVGAVS